MLDVNKFELFPQKIIINAVCRYTAESASNSLLKQNGAARGNNVILETDYM